MFFWTTKLYEGYKLYVRAKTLYFQFEYLITFNYNNQGHKSNTWISIIDDYTKMSLKVTSFFHFNTWITFSSRLKY